MVKKANNQWRFVFAAKTGDGNGHFRLLSGSHKAGPEQDPVFSQ
ncbi:hypothetical protein [Acetobacterium sp.]